MTEWSASARRWRAISCSSGGNNPTARLTVVTTSGVGSVEITRWPVSTAFIAVSMVRASRTSPITTTSGSWRSAARSPRLTSSVSTPISRWVTEELMSRCRNSIGFSSVTTCLRWVWLMWFTSAAIVEVFPEPDAPATRIIPRSAAASVPSTGGSFSEPNVGTSKGMTRMTIMNDERWRRIFTRKRPTPGMPHEQS